MSEQKYVTRRVVVSNTYNVYKIEGETLVLLDTIEAKGKLSEVELCKQYGVDKVVTTLVKTNKAVYGVPVDDFMEIATLIK